MAGDVDRRPGRPDGLPARFRYPTPNGRRRVRTANAVERRFREVRRRIGPVGTFRDRSSMERVPFAILPHQNENDRTAAPFPWRIIFILDGDMYSPPRVLSFVPAIVRAKWNRY